MSHSKEITTYGVVAQFENAHAVLDAAHKAHAAGFRVMEAYSPVPVHGLDEALGRKRSKLACLVLGGGLHVIPTPPSSLLRGPADHSRLRPPVRHP
jgi:hypothetical protein